MKKGLSVLLIAAALFGFYGGAVNLNDVLACKDYWEEENEKTTADLNKLEDGLNQLKDNEEAYLDGIDAVADGEEALAEGEADYAEGQATLAQGEADYAAAPGKLADARKQLAEGQDALDEGKQKLEEGYKQYDEGKKSYKEAPAKLKAGKKAVSGLDQLIDGLTSAKTGYQTQWKPGFENRASASELAKGEMKNAGLEQARGIIKSTLNTDENKKSVALIGSIAKNNKLLDNLNSAKTYADFDKSIKDMISAFDTAGKTLDGFADLAASKAGDEQLAALEQGLRSETSVPVSADSTAPVKSLNVTQLTAVIKGIESQRDGAKARKQELEGKIASLEKLPEDTVVDEKGTTAKEALAAARAGVAECDKGISTASASIASLQTLIDGREEVAKQIGAFAQQAGDKLGLVNSLSPELYSAITKSVGVISANDNSTTNEDFSAAITQLKTALTQLSAALKAKVEDINTNKASFEAWDKGYQSLAGGQKQLADPDKALPYAFRNMLANSTIRKVLDDKASALVPVLTLYSTSRLAGEDLGDFNKDMNTLTADGGVIDKSILVLKGIKAEAQKQLAQGEKDYAEAPDKLSAAKKQLAKGEKDLAAGEAKLAEGKKQYAQGLASYKAAPAKLAEGRAQLAEGLQKLMDGRADLAAGKEKLAEYEDGEQQVRDGLATLMGTEAHGGLTSILDRRNGDDNFDDPNGHLELGEGLDAVTVGRGYQADTGTLVTNEITRRAVGTAAGLGAGALAVLAAILSFLKKNKGAGVSALLAAAAGGCGIAYGTSAGMEFSSIAGSTAGATPWIAAGILAGVALVHAVTHFAAREA